MKQLAHAARPGGARQVIEASGRLGSLDPLAETDREPVDQQPRDRFLDVHVGMGAAQLLDGDGLRMRFYQLWHERSQQSPPHRWFRGLLTEAARRMA